MLRIAILSVLSFALLVVSSLADPKDDAKVAFDKKDYGTALKLLLPLAEQGDTDAQFDVGWIYSIESPVKNETEVVRWWREAAGQGHSNAQCFLGVYYWLGTGVEKNETVGLMWMLIAMKGQPRCKSPAKFHMRFMTTQQIEEAESMAREWLVEHQQ